VFAIVSIIASMPRRKTDGHTYPTLTPTDAAAWRDLHRRLARTRTLQDAKEIAAEAAPPHANRFYAHLRSFVRTLQPPRRHGTRSELYVYGKLRVRYIQEKVGAPAVTRTRDPRLRRGKVVLLSGAR
jgi:hypothetical protein